MPSAGVSAASVWLRPVNAVGEVRRAAARLLPSGSAAAVHLAPTARGGSTEPMLTARIGSSPVASSQRPIQPVLTGSAGEAVCQMSMERKWLKSGFG